MKKVDGTEAYDIYFKEIFVIVKKTETKDFKFVSNKRAGAGFIVTLAGEGRFVCGDYTKDLVAGDVLMIDRTDKYEISARGDGFSYITSAFELGDGQSFREQNVPYCLSFGTESSVLQKFDMLLNVWIAPTRNHLIETRLLLTDLMLEMCKKMGAKQEVSGLDRVFPAVRYLNEHYQEECTVEFLAKLCLLSVSHFRKLFVKHVGKSPMQYRTELRCKEAQGMLKSGMFSISEIATYLGYCDIYHFSKQYKKQMGVCPSMQKKV